MRCPRCYRRLLPDRSCPLHPGHPPLGEEASNPGPVPSVVGWRIAERIGRGGFADVYRATRARDGLVAALKVARRPGDPRFTCEREALIAVGGRIGPEFVDSGVAADGRPWLALEYVRCPTLGHWMGTLPGTGACEPERALSLLGRIADTVDRMHRAGVVHRDLTPDNIVLCDDHGDRVALIDFGLAMVKSPVGRISPMESGESDADAPDLGDRLTVADQRLGTVLYAAPEQLADARSVDARADRYALAAIAFELLTGRPPFVGTTGEVEHAHTARRVPRASQLAALPATVDAVFARGMAKDPRVRYTSAAALVADIARALSAGVAEAATVAAPAMGPRPDGLRQCAVLGAYVPGGVESIRRAVSDEHGRIVRVWGGRIIIAFEHADSPAAGIRAALRAGRSLPPPVRAVIHVVDVASRRLVGRTGLASPELDIPGWLPAEAAWEWDLEPLLLTATAGVELPGYGDAARLAGYLVPPVDNAPAVATRRVALRGCDTLIKQLAGEARHCLGARVPGLCVVTGEVGLGKTRILDHISRMLMSEVRVVSLGAPRPTAPTSLLARLASIALGLEVMEAGGDELGAVCTALLGERPGHRGLAALTERLGITAGAAPEPVAAVPGAARLAVVELVAAGLRRAARQQPLALFIDDADLADAVCLDIVELATLADDGAGPWVLLAASPELSSRRPDLGRRAGRFSGHTLGPLDPADARALLRDLLHPVERIPDATLASIEQLARGVPRYLVDLVDALRAGGAIRRRRGTGAWFLAGDELLHLSATPLSQRLAARKLEALPAALRAFAVTAAVLGTEFAIDQVDAVRLRVESSGALDYGDLDTGVAVARLSHHGILRELGSGRYCFHHPMLRTGIESDLDAELRQRLHGAVYNWLVETETSAAPAARLARRAQHAAASGYRRAAARAWLAAAQADVRVNEDVRAHRWFSAAIEQLARLEPAAAAGPGSRDDATLRLTALSGRAKIRCRLERWPEAEADVEAAHELARELGDDRAVVDGLLDRAMILDWTYRWAEAAECVARAESPMENIDDRRLLARLLLAHGRCACRDNRYDDALALLDRAAETAREVGHHETRVAALLLLPVMLTFAGRGGEAETRFAEVVQLCHDIGDLHHLAVALGNRLLLWESLGRVDRALADGRRTVELARRLGHATLESTAGHNLAQLLYFQGELDEALALAARARDLAHRHLVHPGPEHDLLVARIQRALDREEDLGDTLRALEDYPEETWSEHARLAYDALLLADDDRAGWSAVVDRAGSVCSAFPDEHLDILLMALRAAAHDRRADDVRALLARARDIPASATEMWRRQLARFAGGDDGQGCEATGGA